jgi:hypothetical protein
LFFSSIIVSAQQNSQIKTETSGFIDVFYGYNFHDPKTQSQNNSFLYNYNRHNEFNVNLALIRIKASTETFYGVLSLQTGTYVTDNYANENLKLFNEAYIGFFVNKSKKTSIEAGIMPSHIGFETANSNTNLTLTRSLLAENSPYFMAGIKINHTVTNKLMISGILTNGWQRIDKPNKKALPAFCSQIVYNPNQKSTFNLSTFIGDEPIVDNLRTRYFLNFYWDYKINSKWRSIAGFDMGWQKNVFENSFSQWKTWVFMTQYSINKKWQTAFRLEQYEDKNNTLINTNAPFQTFGSSINFDYSIIENLKWRTEAKFYDSKFNIFQKENELLNKNLILTTSLSIIF